MSTVVEIEEAIAKLAPSQQREIAEWLEERQFGAQAADALLQGYDAEEEGGAA
jgi:hypothetical protein